MIGKYLLLMARGGENVTGDTLARFYALHVVILPLTALAIVGVHLYLVQKHEISVPQDVIKKYGSARRRRACPSFRTSCCGTWSAGTWPWEFSPPWRPSSPGNWGRRPIPSARLPTGIKPEWYFLFMFQALKDLPAYLPSENHQWIEGETLGILFFGFLGLMVALVPFLDRGAAVRPAAARAQFLCNALGGVHHFHDGPQPVIKPPQNPPAATPPASAAGAEGTPEKGTP